MQRVTYVNVSVLTADGFGDLLLEFAGALARAGSSEPIRFSGIGAHGDDETISFIVGPASQIVVESVRTERDAPENAEVAEYMRQRIRELSDPRPASEKASAQPQLSIDL